MTTWCTRGHDAPSSPRWLVLAGALALAPWAAWSAEPLALHTAVEAATSASRLLAANRAQTQAAREAAAAAGQLPDPVLRFGIANLPVNGPDRYTLGQDFMTMRSVGVMQEWTRPDKRRARAALAEREVDASLAAQRLSTAELQQAAALAWFERSLQESLLELLRGQQARAELEVQAAEALYRGGKGSQADVYTARSLVEEIADRITEARRRIAVAQAELARWIGPAADAPLAERTALRLPAWTEGDLAARVADLPQVAQAAQREAAALADAEVARADRRADWSVELMLSQRGSAYSDMVSVNVSVPLQWRQAERQDRQLAAKLALAEQARAEREDLQRAQAAQVQALLAEWTGEQERLRRHDERLLPLAQQRSTAALSAYRAGTGSLASVLEARRAAIEVHMERLDIEAAIARVWSRLEFVMPGAEAASVPAPASERTAP